MNLQHISHLFDRQFAILECLTIGTGLLVFKILEIYSIFGISAL